MTFLLPFAAIVCVGWRLRLSVAMARHAALAGVVMLVPIALVTAPYLASRAARGDRSRAEILHYSAAPEDYLSAHERSRYAKRLDRPHVPERELFPGVTPLLLGAAGMAPPLRVSAIATMVSGALALDWSSGLRGLSYVWLHRWLAPYRGIRVPARFSILVGSALVLLAAFGVARLFRRLPDVGAAVALTVVSGAVLIDLRPRLTLSEHWRTLPPMYASVTSDMVLAEFPMGPEVDVAYMYFSTKHWARMVNGYTGYLPQPYMNMLREIEHFPESDTLARLKQEGATHVTVNCRLFTRPDACREIILLLDESPHVALVSAGRWESMDVRLYALR